MKKIHPSPSPSFLSLFFFDLQLFHSIIIALVKKIIIIISSSSFFLSLSVGKEEKKWGKGAWKGR